jgi:hypothetical protein
MSQSIVIKKHKFSSRNKKVSFRLGDTDKYIHIKDGECLKVEYNNWNGVLQIEYFYRKGKNILCKRGSDYEIFTGAIQKPKKKVFRYANGNWAFGGYSAPKPQFKEVSYNTFRTFINHH